ncbi:MAG: FIVAR domain-containing protein [Bacteroidaceae bacterium]|nr:FIVAR domain-containing protein [Bacteroidaceae bacterium]
MTIRNTILSLLVALLPLAVTAQVTDRIVLGNAESETAHGLITYCPDNTATIIDGLKGQTGRYVKPFVDNPFAGDYPGIYGGEYSFVLRVDGSAQNYLTLRTNGSEAYTDGSRYHVQIEGLNLQDYSRQAVDFSADKAPGAFCYNTLVIPRAVTDGKQIVTVRIRSLGRYWGYATQGNFTGYQRTVDEDLPPIYAVYSSTNPIVELSDEVQGHRGSYASAPAKGSSETLAAMRSRVQSTLSAAIKGEIEGDDFKPAYNNNNFNVVLGMGYAYQRGVYGTKATDLARKIRVAIDSMVYVNNLVKSGDKVTVSSKGQTATTQGAGYGWGGLFGQQGMGIYLLSRAGKVSDAFLNQKPDLGAGTGKTRREQWIEAFRESFDAGLTYSGRRYITNQLMESSHSVYGAALALYALDPVTYHNAPKLALRMMREAVGLDEYTGVPANAKFDGTIKDSDGYPTYELGDPATAQSSTNYWGHHFHATTAKGNGREQGWTCTSCYGNMAGRICDMYLATLYDPFIGTHVENGKGDPEILMVATNNARHQAYFTYPTVDSDGNRGIIGESSMCWRNRYDPGKNYYGNLLAAYLADDSELMGHMLQAYKNGHYSPDTNNNLFPWGAGSYWLGDAIEALSTYASQHDSDYPPVPSTDGQPDYMVGDPQDGVVAVKHGDNHLFVNFLANDCPLWSGQAHLITPVTAKVIQFAPEVKEFYHSGKTKTLSASYWNGNHKIKYPDDPQMAYGGMTYEYPAYDAEGHYNGARTSCQYYQQLLGQYLVAQNCSESDSYSLQPAAVSVDGLSAFDIETGKTVTLSTAITLAPLTTKVYYIASLTSGSQLPSPDLQSSTEAESLKTRVSELLAFARTASTQLSTNKTLLTYSRDAFMPFFLELTRAAYAANSGTMTAAEVTAEATALEQAYQTFLDSKNGYDACTVPGRMDYKKNIGTSGSVNVMSKTNIKNAKNGARVFVPIVATETGDYVVKVKAKSQVYDEYKSTLNVDIITIQQFLSDTAPIDASRTQQIAYDQFDYTPYQWTIHLEAGQTAILRYTFGGESTTYTVDVSTTDIATMAAGEKLAITINEAQTLLQSYEGSDLVTEEARQALATAIVAAQTVADKATATDSELQAAIDSLKAAMTTFNSSVTVLESHVLDLSTAICNSNINFSHQSRWPDDTKTIALRANNWGKVYVGRYDMSKVRQILVRSNIKSHQLYCYGLRAYAVPVASTAYAITTTEQLNTLSTDDSYRIATYYGDETVDGEVLKEGNTTWKIGPQRIIDLRKQSVTANEADFQEKWGSGAVVPMTGYTYNDEAKTDVKATFESAYNTAYTADGIADIFFQFGAQMWGEITIGEVIVITEESGEAVVPEPEPDGEGVAYKLSTTWDGTVLYFSLPQEEGGYATLSATETEVMLVPRGDKHVMTTADGTYYLTYKSGSTWDLVSTASSASAALLEVAIDDKGLMTLKAANGYVGINTKNAVVAGEPIYGDCNPSTHKTNFTYQWNTIANPYTVTVDATTNGTVVADRNTAYEGDVVTLSVTPAENYTLETITVTAYTNEDSDAAGTDNHQSSKAPAINGNIALTTITEGKEYTFVMPACNVKVHATFADATGIHGTVNRQSSDGKYFDLQGRPVSHPVKGLYIVNGEKVVIK